jgi:hypothetical protein
MKVYIAGPMTGIPQFNYPAFHGMARDLRKVVIEPGVHIDAFDPTEADPEHVQEWCMASEDGRFPDPALARWPTHGEFVARGVRTIIDGGFDAIVVLPDWGKSRGARTEVMAGLASGCRIVKPEVMYGGRITLWELPTSELIRGLEGEPNE